MFEQKEDFKIRRCKIGWDFTGKKVMKLRDNL